MTDYKFHLYSTIFQSMAKLISVVEDRYINCNYFMDAISKYEFRETLSCKSEIPYALCVLEFYSNLIKSRFFIRNTHIDKTVENMARTLLNQIKILKNYYKLMYPYPDPEHRCMFICLYAELNEDISCHFGLPAYTNPFISKEYLRVLNEDANKLIFGEDSD